MVDGEFREYILALKKWNMGNNVVYKLISQWNSFIKNNAFRQDDLGKVWAFCRSFKLGFAIIKANGVALAE